MKLDVHGSSGVAILSIMLAIACGDGSSGDGGATPTEPTTPQVASIAVEPSSLILTAIGETSDLEATVRDESGNTLAGIGVRWSSSDETIVTVDGSGVVTANADGQATVTARADGAEASVDITVTSAAVETVAPSGGSVQSTDKRLTLTVPDGAVTTNTEVTVQGLANPPQNLAIGDATKWNYVLEPDGKQFDKPLQATWDLDGNPDGEGTSLLLWNSDASRVEVLPVDINRSTNTVTAEIRHFSVLMTLVAPVDSEEGWRVWRMFWGGPVVRYYVAPKPEGVFFSWLTDSGGAQRVAEAFSIWDREESSLRFEPAGSRSEAQIVFEEAGSAAQLINAGCPSDLNLQQAEPNAIGLTCFDKSALLIESQLDANDRVVIRVASDEVDSSFPALWLVAHEIGHALGIRHTTRCFDSPPAIMNSGTCFSRGLPQESTLRNVDIAALLYHYEPNQPPAVTIDQPADGAEFEAGETIEFQATASDPEDGELSGDAIVWTSDRDGKLGSGASLGTSVLSGGPHVVIAEARDKDGKRAQAEIRITVASGETFVDCDVCPEMVVIPGGRFTMGSPPSEPGHEVFEEPQHEVRIQPFALGQFEVTVAEFETYARDVGLDWIKRVEDVTWLGPEHPAVGVSWDEARGYVEWLSARTGKAYRLPSEAEWEYAARAGTTTRRYWGDDLEDRLGCRYANVLDSSWNCSDGYPNSAPVGAFEPNDFGLYDMLGNVEEWTEDCLHLSYQGAPTDGSAWISGDNCSRRMLRGGSWFDRSSSDVRSAYRNSRRTTALTIISGFRVARALGG